MEEKKKWLIGTSDEAQYFEDQLTNDGWAGIRFADWYLPNYYHPEEWLRVQEEKNRSLNAMGITKGLYVPEDPKRYWLRATYFMFCKHVWSNMPTDLKTAVTQGNPDTDYLEIVEAALPMSRFQQYLDQRSFS